VKRLLVLTVMLSLAATALYTSSGSAQTTLASIDRGFPVQVTATTTPKRDRLRPYKFTTTGKILPPAKYCGIGVKPTPGTGNCMPILCPAGATDIKYCFVPGRKVICTGTVTVRVQKHGTTISSRNVGVRPDCTYRSTVSFTSRLPTRRGVFSIRARFQGNPVLQPRNSATKTVRAG
jgi:hypothetical protein